MLSKEKCGKTKHYTSMEKNVFLHILKDYKNIIEIKKSDSSTLKDKELAWHEICTKYNENTLVHNEVRIMINCACYV